MSSLLRARATAAEVVAAEVVVVDVRVARTTKNDLRANETGGLARISHGGGTLGFHAWRGV